MKKKPIEKILWTGGFDSTYRMVELSMRDIRILPIYVIDPGRQSTEYELNAMHNITEFLKHHPKTKAKILPVQKIHLEDIPENPEVTEAYQKLKQATDKGIQYEWLARLTFHIPMINFCLETTYSVRRPFREFVLGNGKLIDTGDGYIVDREHSSKEINLLYGNVKLPIFDKTNQEMYEDLKKWGYEDVIHYIWYCHTPLDGKPCGFCVPCNVKIIRELYFLVPKKALKRNRRMKFLKKHFGENVQNKYIHLVKMMHHSK